MKRSRARSLPFVAAALLAAAACKSDPDPPLIPLPGAPPALPPGQVAADPTPQPAQPAQPSPAKPRSTSVPSSPFPIPWPQLLPEVPGIVPPVFPTPASTGANAESQRVIVYGTTWCPACNSLKQRLTARGIPFVFVNLEDPTAIASPAGAHLTEMPKEMRTAIPVTRVTKKDGTTTWVQGDDPDRIEKAYRGT